MKTRYVICALLLLTCLLATPIFGAGSAPTKPDDKAIDQKSMVLISGIYGIDLSKYEVIVNASGTSKEEFTAFGPRGVLQFGHYTLVNGESIVYVNFEFVNGYLWYCTLDNIKGKPIFVSTVSTDVINQSKSILSSYQTFASQNYAGDTSYVSEAKTMLSNVSELKNTKLTSNNAKMEIKDKQLTLTECIRTSTIDYYFSSNGIDYTQKRLGLEFINCSLRTVSDTWSLVSLGPPNLLSRQEALDLAWATANSYNLSFISQDGSIYQVKPDLTNATVDASLAYTTRNSSLLYPLWNIYYYFATPINGDYGIQLAIWGDTKEITYCQSMTTLGTPDTSPPSNPSLLGILPNNLVWLILSGIALTIAIAVLFVWKTHKSTR